MEQFADGARKILGVGRLVPYVCKNCKREIGDTVVKPTPGEPDVLPGSYASASAIAHIAVQNHVMYSPFYQLEQELARMGLKLSRQIR